jgi:hypothetical protein
MSVRVSYNCSTAPLGVARCTDNGARIIAQRGYSLINRRNAESNPRSECRCTVRAERIKLEHTARMLCGAVLWS